MAGEIPVTVEPIVAPVVDAAPAPVAIEAAPAPVVQHPAEVPTLLEGLTNEAPKTEAAPAETEKVEAAPAEKPADKPVEAKTEVKVEPEAEKPVEAAPEPPVEYKFEFAENVKPQADKVAAFTDFAREHKLTPEAAQKAMGFFNEAASAFVAQQQEAQIKAWNDTRTEWRNKAMADAEIGGAGHTTAMRAIARMRDLSVSDAIPGSKQYETDLAEFNDFLRITGAGDHPAYLKQMHRFARYLDEPKLPAPNPKPTPTNGQRPSTGFYTKNAAETPSRRP
jgi:hypothetical protein